MTRTAVAATTVPLADLAESWYVALAAEHKARQTLRAYQAGVDQFLAWCAEQGPAEPVLDAPAVRGYLADLLESGQSPQTARLRFAALRLFSRWLVAEGETPRDQLANVKPPQASEPDVPKLSDGELSALIQACKRGTVFTARRDEAIVRLMAETGLRAGECIGLSTADVDVKRGVAVIRRAKGGKHRMVGFGPETGRALDRYLRARRGHKRAHTPPLWLPQSGKTFGYQGLLRALGLRAAAADIDGFHPHRLRHTAASRWLQAGGSEGGLMAMAGWSDRSMLDRYVKDTASDRAIAESRRLGLGQIG